MKRILILGAPIFQIPVVKKAKEMGIYTGIVDINESAPAFPYADETFVESIRDKEAVHRIADKFKPDGILLGACDTGVQTGAYVSRCLNLPGHTEETALKATDKVEMLKAFKTHGVASPLYQVIRKDEIDSSSIELPFPVISKPTDSAGGRGINLIASGDDLAKLLHESSEAGQSGDILIEEYMDGPEVSVEMVIAEGVPYVLQITDKLTSGEPHFFEIGHAQPSSLDETTKAGIALLAQKAALSLGLVNSVAHAEIKMTKNGPKMVEIGARLGGDWITSYLIETSIKGINMIEAAIHLALGEPLDMIDYRNSGEAAAVLFLPSQTGRVIAIRGIEEAKRSKGIIRLEILAEIGKTYSEAIDDTERFGYIIAKGQTKNDALICCEDAIKKLSITMV